MDLTNGLLIAISLIISLFSYIHIYIMEYYIHTLYVANPFSLNSRKISSLLSNKEDPAKGIYFDNSFTNNLTSVKLNKRSGHIF